MFKLIGLFHATDEEAFLEMYMREILPKFLNIPGCIKVETTRLQPTLIPGIKKVEKPYTFLAEMYFPTAKAIQYAFNTPEGQLALEVFIEKANNICSTYAGEEYVHYKDAITMFHLQKKT